MSLSLWLGLLLCNLAWSFNPAAAKFLVQEIGPEQAAWAKYACAFSAYLVFMIFSSRGRLLESIRAGRVFMLTRNRRDLLTVAGIGFATCFFSPITQMLGLRVSSAVNNCLLTTFEPLLTILFGWLLLGERLHRSHWISFGLAIAGFVILSGILGTRVDLAASMGDLILILAIGGEALYSVLARKLIRNYPGTVIFGTALGIGFLLLSAVVIPWHGLPSVTAISVHGWMAILWLGVLGTTLPYLYWLHVLSRSVSLGSIVLSLFLQPVLGSAAGMLLLKERPNFFQISGGLLIFAAVLFQFAFEKRIQPSTVNVTD